MYQISKMTDPKIFSGLSTARPRESGVSFRCSEAKHYNSFVVKTHGYSKKKKKIYSIFQTSACRNRHVYAAEVVFISTELKTNDVLP